MQVRNSLQSDCSNSGSDPGPSESSNRENKWLEPPEGGGSGLLQVVILCQLCVDHGSKKVEIKLPNKTKLGFVSQPASVIVTHGHPLAHFSALRINCFLLTEHLICQRTRYTRQTKVSEGFLSSSHPSVFPLTSTRFRAKPQTQDRDDLQHLKLHRLQ